MKTTVLGLGLLVSFCACAEDSIPVVDLEVPPEISSHLLSPAAVNPQPVVHQLVDANALIRAAARKHRVPAAFVKSIMAAESNFDAMALSPKGAIGLMQLMPSTAELFGADPHIPAQNVICAFSSTVTANIATG
jgi:Transglycosylase SLT domain